MGIPKFFSWFANQDIFQATIINNRRPDEPIDIFAIDANGLIHNNVNRETRDQAQIYGGQYAISQEELYRIRYSIFRGVFRDIIGLTQTVRPRRSLYIFIDGVAPQAKINQQRNRRYKGATERKPTDIFDRNVITPGTEFMRELDTYIRQELDRVMKLDELMRQGTPQRVEDPYARVLPPHIIYSSYLVPGEGEHKIASELRNVVAKGQTLVVHGQDADLIMIYLMQLRNGWSNIYLFRDNGLNYSVDTMIDMRAMERVLRQLYPGVPEPLDDFVVILFLIGNDFLPHFPVFERVHDALTTLVSGYSQFVQEIKPVEGTSVGITTGSGINWPNFARFLEYITVNYNSALLRAWGENRDALVKQSLVAERCITRAQQIIGTQSQCVATLDVEKFRPTWYRYIFSPKPPRPNQTTFIEPTPEDIDNIIIRYLEGITWVYNYYRHGAEGINVGWYYPFHYAPVFSDLHTFITQSFRMNKGATWEVNPIHLQSDFVSPLEQLVMVMPPGSLTSVPPPLRPLYSETSSIYDLMPEGFWVDFQGKMEEWAGVAILPIPLPVRVIRAVLSLNLPPQFVAQFNAQENLVINRNITQSFRIRGVSGPPRGGSAQRRGRGRGRGRGTQVSTAPIFNPSSSDYRRTFT